ncbi:4038_t:CDS:2, partial [Dentiscutata heterogama]
MATATKEVFDAAADILAVYIPVIGAVKQLVGEIYQIYENAECNKELCLIMVDRVKAAESSMDRIVRSVDKNKEDFREKSYYRAFERFKNILTQIKEYTKSVSKLKGYKKFLHATDVKNKFDQLRKDFDNCMADLHFAIDVATAIDESERVDNALKEVDESLKQLDIKLDESLKQVGNKFEDSYKQVGDKLEGPIDGQNESELAIIRKLGLSPQIIKFYGQAEINNSKVIIFEWAERGNLRELYNKYDIPWTRKIQIAKEILFGLLFLRTVNVFHHDVRCENIFVLGDLSVKLGNFGCAREVDANSRNLSQLATYIVRWMAPELIKKYVSYGNYENKRVYTFNCEMFSYGMLLWELCYEKLPYANWNIKQIADHVLNAWCHQPELRITIPTLRQKLEKLARNYPIPDDAPPLLKNKVLDLDGLKYEEILPQIDDNPEILDEDIPDEVAVIQLSDGIKMHKEKKYQNAWECFKQNAELDNPVAKFWLGYYLLYGYNGEKDPIQARKFFKEAADENNHSESQCRYAVSLLGDLNKESNETTKDELRKEIVRYFALAADNLDNRNTDAMYYLGDIYYSGKLRVKKDEERGLNYLRFAAEGKNERAIALLKKL